MRHRLVFIVTHPTTAWHLLRGQLAFLREHGFDVTVIASPGPELQWVAEREGVRVVAVPMSRDVRLTEGPRALIALTRELRALRPHIVNASTPKAGLLGMIAARALSIPGRVYLLRGLRLEGSRGVARISLGGTERLAAACAHHVVCVSESLRRVFVDSGYASARKTSVLPSNGIDIERFRERAATRGDSARVRGELGIPAGAPVIGFVGRLVADKGVADIIEAFESVQRVQPDARLLIVGGDLAGDTLPEDLTRRLQSNPRVVLAGKVRETAAYYAAMDLLVFPSYREGLPNVPLEAAACEVPAVGYRSTGVVDAIADGVTGRIVKRGDAAALGEGLVRYLGDAGLRERDGVAGRKRVVREFSNERTWEGWLRVYRDLI